VIPFARILRELQNPRFHHFIVERDTQPDPARTARAGSALLRDLRGRRRRRPAGPAERGRASRG